jgi:hypothetical protein
MGVIIGCHVILLSVVLSFVSRYICVLARIDFEGIEEAHDERKGKKPAVLKNQKKPVAGINESWAHEQEEENTEI